MNDSYFVVIENERLGPLCMKELEILIQGGRLAKSDLIWTKGLKDWQKCNEIEEVVNLFENAPPKVPDIKVPCFEPVKELAVINYVTTGVPSQVITIMLCLIPPCSILGLNMLYIRKLLPFTITVIISIFFLVLAGSPTLNSAYPNLAAALKCYPILPILFGVVCAIYYSTMTKQEWLDYIKNGENQ